MIPFDAPPINISAFVRERWDDAEYWRPRKPNGRPYTAEDVSGRHAHCGFDVSTSDRYLYAVCEGRVEYVDFGPSYGIQTVIRHANGSGAFYAHQARRTVSRGEAAKPGQLIGIMGTTGGVPLHLHFSVPQRWYVARFENCGPQLRALKLRLAGTSSSGGGGDLDMTEQQVRAIVRDEMQRAVRFIMEGGASQAYDPNSPNPDDAWIRNAAQVSLRNIANKIK